MNRDSGGTSAGSLSSAGAAADFDAEAAAEAGSGAEAESEAGSAGSEGGGGIVTWLNRGRGGHRFPSFDCHHLSHPKREQP